jgi:hypothetical protein
VTPCPLERSLKVGDVFRAGRGLAISPRGPARPVAAVARGLVDPGFQRAFDQRRDQPTLRLSVPVPACSRRWARERTTVLLREHMLGRAREAVVRSNEPRPLVSIGRVLAVLVSTIDICDCRIAGTMDGLIPPIARPAGVRSEDGALCPGAPGVWKTWPKP